MKTATTPPHAHWCRHADARPLAHTHATVEEGCLHEPEEQAERRVWGTIYDQALFALHCRRQVEDLRPDGEGDHSVSKAHTWRRNYAHEPDL